MEDIIKQRPTVLSRLWERLHGPIDSSEEDRVEASRKLNELEQALKELIDLESIVMDQNNGNIRDRR